MATQTEAAAQFKHLFTPLRVGSFTVRNRIVSTAHGTGYGIGGLPTQRHLDYWASKAKGGIGLIVTGASVVHPSAGRSPAAIQLWRDECIEPFRRIADAIHQHDARIVVQINHAGRANYGAPTLDPVWSASPIVSKMHMGTPREMTVDEIQLVIEAFASAARRMREAGLDGVEVHCGQDYLIETFMSPLFNQREDEYGGSEENRLRFAHEVIAAVRKAVGRDFTVGIRVNGDEYEEDGLNQEDMQRIVGALAASGQLDYVSVNWGLGGNASFGMSGPVIPPMYVPPGAFVYLAAGIKQVTELPVICVGRINTPVLAEAILERNEADLVGMTRANLCDPELPNKAREGRLDEIRYCIACNEGCLNHGGSGLTCAINASVGREAETQITPAPVSKRVMVIGGGIAGMEAARVAALRGHQVTLYERESQMGGQLQIAAKAPGRAEMAEPVRYYTKQFDLLAVPVHMGVAVDEKLVRREKPDAVIVATGGLPALLAVDGIDEYGKAEGVNVVLAWDVLDGTAEVTGGKVAVFATDQGMEGLTTADFLAERGKEVEVLIPYPNVGARLEWLVTKWVIMDRLARKDVKLSIMTAVKAVREGVIYAFSPPNGPERPLEGVETLVISAGSRSNDALWKALRGQVKEIYNIGESVSPRRLLASSLDGLKIGLRV